MLSSRDALAQLWSLAALPSEACRTVVLTGAEPALPSSFCVGTAAQASIAASALMAAEIHHLRSGQLQDIAVDMRDAAILFRSERYLSLNGVPCPEPMDAIFGLFQCGDGRWVRLHTNFPHHRDGVLRLLVVSRMTETPWPKSCNPGRLKASRRPAPAQGLSRP